MTPPGFFVPDWPAPANVGALMTTREGGLSPAPFASNNMGGGGGDSPALVARNRAKLVQASGMGAGPVFLRQVHSAQLIWQASGVVRSHPADAHWTDQAGLPLAVMAADCLPVLACDERGRLVMAIHAGWRGLCAGIVAQALREMRARLPSNTRIFVWLGPCIGACHFAIGAEVRAAFLAKDSAYEEAFSTREQQHFASLHVLARAQLRDFSGLSLSADGRCTVCESQQFYSYRREGQTGRMAAIIWRR